MVVVFQIACQKIVICSSNSIKFLCWTTLYRGQVAAGPIKSCTMVWNNDEAESLTTEECHEMATMTLHKATGPFSLYDTWKGDQLSLTNTSWTQETSLHKSNDNFFVHSSS